MTIRDAIRRARADIRAEGHYARQLGLALATNPYRRGTAFAFWWTRGWAFGARA